MNPIQQNECQSSCAYDDPKSEPLKKWTKAYALQRFPVEPCTDQKERHRQATPAQLVEGAKGPIPCGQQGIQQGGKAEQQNEPWPVDSRLGLQCCGGDKR